MSAAAAPANVQRKTLPAATPGMFGDGAKRDPGRR
jgi:hypothetical protein